MKILLRTPKLTWNTCELVAVQLLVINDSYEAVNLDRRLLIGPNPLPDPLLGTPFPISVEPVFQDKQRNIVVLNPWCFYGRERSWAFGVGKVTFFGYLLRRSVKRLGLQGPSNPEVLSLVAEPLLVRVR